MMQYPSNYWLVSCLQFVLYPHYMHIPLSSPNLSVTFFFFFLIPDYSRPILLFLQTLIFIFSSSVLLCLPKVWYLWSKLLNQSFSYLLARRNVICSARGRSTVFQRPVWAWASYSVDNSRLHQCGATQGMRFWLYTAKIWSRQWAAAGNSWNSGKEILLHC